MMRTERMLLSLGIFFLADRDHPPANGTQRMNGVSGAKIENHEKVSGGMFYTALFKM